MYAKCKNSILKFPLIYLALISNKQSVHIYSTKMVFSECEAHSCSRPEVTGALLKMDVCVGHCVSAYATKIHYVVT